MATISNNQNYFEDNYHIYKFISDKGAEDCRCAFCALYPKCWENANFMNNIPCEVSSRADGDSGHFIEISIEDVPQELIIK